MTTISLFAMGTRADDGMQKSLQKLAGEASKGYIDPITQGLLTNFNGGLFHKAPQTKIFGFDFEFGLAVMATPLGNLDREFTSSNLPFTFNQSQADIIAAGAIVGTGIYYDDLRTSLSTALQSSVQTIGISGPTVVGKKYDPTDPNSEVKISLNGNVTFHLPGGLGDSTLNVSQVIGTKLGGIGNLGEAAAVPFWAPQVTIGTVYGTQFTLRYLPKIALPDFGDLSWTGFGIQHNIGMWLPIPFVDVSASFYTQKIKIDPMFELSGTSFGINASKEFGFSFLNVTPYVGFMIEKANMKVKYTPDAVNFGPGVTPPTIAFDIDGKNTSRLTLGLSVRLVKFNLNADYNIGKYNSMTAGIFFAL
jgi:hypothetical protein